MKGLRGYLFFLACYFAYAIALMPVTIIVEASHAPQAHQAPDDTTFMLHPKDRPLLETPQQVLEARTTGVSTFYFDGTYYIVENLPKHYVDYSSWYVRMP